MTTYQRATLAALAAVLLGTASAGAADLYGGSLKDGGGYVAPVSTRPALFYFRGDYTASNNNFDTVTELPNYTQSGATIGNNHALGLGVGMYFSPSLRGDLTLDWSNSASVDGSVVDGAATIQGERHFGVKHLVGLANVYYDFGSRARFSPYIGVGLGFARNTTTAGVVSISGCDSNVNGVHNCAASTDGRSKTNAAGALMAGFSAHLVDRWSLDAGYRFLYTGDASTGDINITRIINSPTYPQSTPGVHVIDLYEHQFRVGLRMDLR